MDYLDAKKYSPNLFLNEFNRVMSIKVFSKIQEKDTCQIQQ